MCDVVHSEILLLVLLGFGIGELVYRLLHRRGGRVGGQKGYLSPNFYFITSLFFFLKKVFLTLEADNRQLDVVRSAYMCGCANLIC